MSFNVRIQNKYDTLQNWLDSSLVLKAGEIALATVDTKDANSGEYVPTVLMKVGDGSKTFAQLPWTAARAADVYGWAKLENPTIEQLPGNLKTAITNLQAAIGEGGSVADAIKAAIDGLDNNDAVVANQFVTAAVQVDGKVTVSRRALEAADIPALEISKINGLQSALNAKVSNTEFSAYKESNAEALAGVKATADAAAVKSEVETALAGKADKTQVATDIANAIEPLATTAALNEVKATAEAARTEEEVNSQIDTKIAALDLANTYEPKGAEANANGYTDQKVDALKSNLETQIGNTNRNLGQQISATSRTANNALELANTNNNKLAGISKDETVVELIAAAQEAATYDDTQVKADIKANADAIDALETYVGTIPEGATATDIVGYVQEKTAGVATEDAVTELGNRVTTVEGKVATIEGDYLKAADKTELQGNIDDLTEVVETLRDGLDTEKVDGVLDLINYVEEHGPEVEGMKKNIEANAAAIKLESETARTAEGLLDGRLTALEGINHDAYKAADATLKSDLQKEIDADVKAAIDAEIERADAAYDVAGAAATAKSEAIADAAGKYETKGTAQGIVDGLKLSETYEPIGAENRAIAAAKTETEKQVKALADGAVADNAAEIAKIVAGTTPVAKATDADKLGGQAAANYLLKSDAPGYGDILTKTAAEAGYKKVQTAVAEKGAANKTLKISQNAQGVIATEEVDIAIAATQVSGLATVATSGKINDLTQTDNTVIVFNCGTASTVI